MLHMEKPCTEIPITSRLLLPERDASFFEKSKDVLTQTTRPSPFPLEGGRFYKLHDGVEWMAGILRSDATLGCRGHQVRHLV